ncbi:Phosphoserine phosphatase rsbU,stage II sporulation protein E,Stage II sporulation protein E (SpoIIE) [Chlamydia poikilotherma]|uniref:Phosphoserine phosphatase rsbU,stage II sporulation protein E,Stage II sporulation protein E (SpoIIE) n=1 Tax=Chlamydia poikilotherma TaxID=1967783 RepID=A0A3B0PQE9_9CHLA|nr:PP2C family protein-serine/threonine phosphatase [Chlamydia poikilotherma]SYX09423.1 Phosphoserine phosphatase rsbU,stage II sporulation protein E,Stage II sporulation protein E (SpoIIE) [Chlamydia poikilotherma]
MIPFTKTIGYRLWLACVAAILIPLGINIVLLNLRQYHTTVSSVTVAFKENAAFKVDTLMQIVPLNADVLALFSEVLDLDEGIPSVPNVELSNEMQRIFSSTYDEISLIKLQSNGEKIVVASSLPNHLGENYQNKIDIPNNLPFSATFKQSSDGHEVFSIMQANIFDNDTHELLGILYTTHNVEKFLEDILVNTQAYFTIKTAILSKDGIILKASDPDLDLRSIHDNVTEKQFCDTFLDESTCPKGISLKPLSLTPLSIEPNFFSFKNGDREIWSYLANVPNMDLHVLSYGTKAELFSSFWKRTLIYFAYFLCVVLGSIIAYLAAKRLSLPIRKLATVIIQTRKNIRDPYVDDSLGFEVNRLGHIFNAMVQSLDQQQTLAEKNYEIKESAQNALRLGEQAQQRLLPNTLPNYPHTELAKAYIPAITVGGDFFDAFIVGEGDQATLFLIVADASGKGVHACGYSLFLKNMLRTFLSQIPSIKEAVEQTASLFYKNTADSGMFVTLCVYSYNYKTGVIEFYSCGHNPACYLSPNGNVSLLSHRGMALGFLPNIPDVPTESFHPAPGSLIVLYSDGITEAHNKDFEMFGEERLKSIVQTLVGKSAEDAMHSLMLSVKTFVGNCHQHDDITLLILKISDS